MRSLLPPLVIALLTLAACDGCPSADSRDDEAMTNLEDWLEAETQSVDDVDDLVDEASKHQLMLLGEATHGTKEFYDWRTDFTMALADRGDLDFVAFEADWDSARVADRWVTGDDPRDVDEMLVDAFDRWGEDWMYANEHVADLLRQIRAYNDEADDPIRIYGIDMHGFFESLDRLIDRLEAEYPDDADDIVADLDCLAEYAPEPGRYRRHVQADADAGCKDEIRSALEAVRQLYDGTDPDDVSARKHARAVAAGEAQYRSHVDGDPNDFWNIRATHMADATEALLEVHGDEPRGAVWAHNTHVGDARATDMADQNRVNIGQLARESIGDDHVWALGFSTYTGEVLAADNQGHPPRVMDLPQAPDETLDGMLTNHDATRYVVEFSDSHRQFPPFERRPGQRAVGVTYHPDREVPGNYIPTNPAQRYEALMFIEETSPLQPLAGK